MAIIVTNEGNFKKKELIPAGSYIARCYSMVVIGTHEEEFKGEKKMIKKIRITWELPNEVRVFKEENGEQPFSISKEYTLSLSEKANLTGIIQSWIGRNLKSDEKQLDITLLLGKPCMISIIHKISKAGNEYATVTNVNQMPKGMVCPPLHNPIVEFSVDRFDKEIFESLPNFIQEKIQTSVEYLRLSIDLPRNEKVQYENVSDDKTSSDIIDPVDDDNDDDLPF